MAAHGPNRDPYFRGEAGGVDKSMVLMRLGQSADAAALSSADAMRPPASPLLSVIERLLTCDRLPEPVKLANGR